MLSELQLRAFMCCYSCVQIIFAAVNLGIRLFSFVILMAFSLSQYWPKSTTWPLESFALLSCNMRTPLMLFLHFVLELGPG